MPTGKTPLAPHYHKDGVAVYHGDCAEILPSLPDQSFVSCITDPPFGLSSMGWRWDEALPDPSIWAQLFRLLKPGGHLLSFGGTRTWHRLACAIEDAGFDIHDMMFWIYANGWPKSLDISKGLAKRGSSAASRWAGWATRLKPAAAPVLMALRPTDGTVLDNAENHGVAGFAIEQTRIRAQKNTFYAAVEHKGRWPTNLVLGHFPECEFKGTRLIQNQAGNATGREPSSRTAATFKRVNRKGFRRYGGPDGLEMADDWACADGCPVAEIERQGSRGASRFFYQARPDRDDRGTRRYGPMPLFGVSESADVNDHPSVKPIDLMKHLCLLTKQPDGGAVIDPFMGSGTTLLAARAAGRPAVGIERELKYVEIAIRRLEERR